MGKPTKGSSTRRGPRRRRRSTTTGERPLRLILSLRSSSKLVVSSPPSLRVPVKSVAPMVTSSRAKSSSSTSGSSRPRRANRLDLHHRLLIFSVPAFKNHSRLFDHERVPLESHHEKEIIVSTLEVPFKY